jgi:hypothetical protein
MQTVQQRIFPRSSNHALLVRWLTPDIIFDLVQRRDPLERLTSDW